MPTYIARISHGKDSLKMLEISVDERLPANEDEIVLAIVSGKPFNNLTLYGAYELATYIEGEGWFFEQYPERETPKVSYWMPLPEAPKGGA